MSVLKRNLAILKMCLEQKFMTLKQIAKKFFPESRKELNWPMKCVRQLVNEGLLCAVRPNFCAHVLYTVTPKGVKLLKRHHLANGLRAIEEIDDRTWEHDWLVTEVRIIFEELVGCEEWICERLLKKQSVRKKVPDGIVTCRCRKYVIEVERKLKNKPAYKKIFPDTCIRDYPEDPILYIVQDESDKNWLMRQAEGWKQIYFTTAEAVLKPDRVLQAQNVKGETIRILRQYRGGIHFYHPEEEIEEDLIDEYDGQYGLQDIYEGQREWEHFDAEYKRLKAQGLSDEEIDKLWGIDEAG